MTTKFKIGDRVKRKKGAGPAGSRREGEVFIIRGVDSLGYLIDEIGASHNAKNLELATPSWETLQVGDVIVREDGSKAKILAVLGDVFLRSRRDNFEKACEWLTIREVQEEGWTFKDSEEIIDFTLELTLKQVAEKFNVDVDKLRIKK